MSREYPTMKGTVRNVRKRRGVTFGFVSDAVPMNGYQGLVPSWVLVREDTLDGAPMKEGMRIAFDFQPSKEKHPRKKCSEAFNVMELHD